jgi:hypothetical protein
MFFYVTGYIIIQDVKWKIFLYDTGDFEIHREILKKQYDTIDAHRPDWFSG